MESATSVNVSRDATTLLSTFTSTRTLSTRTTMLLQNSTSTTSALVPPYPEEGEDELFMWMPLIFVVVFAVIVVLLIVLSRFNFRSPCCNSWGLRQASGGETC